MLPKGISVIKTFPRLLYTNFNQLILEPRIEKLICHQFHTSFTKFQQMHVIQVGGCLQRRDTLGKLRLKGGIGAYVKPNDPENVAFPVVDLLSDITHTQIKEKAVMMGILVGMRKCVDDEDSVVIISDCIEAVGRLSHRFSSPQVDIRYVPSKYVSKANRLARKNMQMQTAKKILTYYQQQDSVVS